MKFDTAAHELAYNLAEDSWEGSVESASGAFAAVDLDEWISDQRITSLTIGSAHLIVTENSDGIVVVRGYEKDERDRLIQQYRNTDALWSAEILPDQAIEAVGGYLEAALFTATDEDGDSLDGLGHSWSEQAQLEAQNVVTEFITSNAEDCHAFAEKHGGWTQVGIDFLFTRNREGAGFWDRGAADLGQRLTEAAHPHGEVRVYLSDRGELEFESA